MPLTELQIKHLKARDRLYRVTDGNGLTLTITPAGGKLWHVRYRYNGKQQTYSLGRYPLVGLAQARKGRDEVHTLLLAGKHPTREKRATKLRRSIEGENTFGNVCRKWLSQKSATLNQKYAKQTLARMEQHVFPLIGDLPITEITIPDCVHVLEKIAKRGTIETAMRMKQVISQTFRYAAQRGLCIHNPASDMRDVLPKKIEKHHPCIPIDEAPELLQKMKTYQGDFLTKGLMQLALLTFLRTRELIEAKWSEIDFDRAEWQIPKARMKKKHSDHIVYLSRQALEVFQSLKALTGQHEFVFYSGISKSKHISNGTILMALRRMGYQGRMTGHGFRTLASTLLNEKGYPPDVIERQLSHADKDKVRSAYNRAEYLLERKKMMQDYADLLDTLQETSTSNIVYKLFANHK